jgi:hypothetical protein
VRTGAALKSFQIDESDGSVTGLQLLGKDGSPGVLSKVVGYFYPLVAK